MFKKLLTFFIILLILFVIAFVSIFATLFFRINLLYSFVIFFGIILGYFILKYLSRKIRRYIRIRRLGVEESLENPHEKQFEESFINALLHTRKFNKTHKNKMPWYVLLGAHESGKSSLVNGSRVYTLSDNIDPTLEVLPTQSAYCWALDDVVIAESSGGIFLNKPSRIATKGFKQLIDKIKANKRHINVKGFIVTLSIDQLYGDQDKLVEYALKLRTHIEQSSKKYGFSYPIYLILTKADHIQGFDNFASALPDEITQQGFGQLFELKDFYLDSKAQINQWATNITSRIRGFNTLALQANSTLTPRVLLLENNINNLKKPLIKFLDAFFKVKAQIKEDNPALRGLFLTSAKQDANIDLLDKQTILEDIAVPLRPRYNSQGLFIDDIFSNILPNDRRFYQRLSVKQLVKRRNYRRLIITWWVALIGSSAYLGVAYAHAIEAFMEIQQASKIRKDQFGDRLNYNLLLISQMNQDINRMIDIRDNWFFSIWPYSSTLNKMIKGYKDYYVDSFNHYILGDLEKTLAKNALLVQKPQHKQNFGFVVENIVQRINLIQAKLDLMPYSNIQSLHMNTLLVSDDFTPNEYGSLYKNYVAWNKHLISLKQQRGKLLKLLDSMDLFDQPYTWLTKWVDEVSQVRAIHASNYWPENDFNEYNEPTIAPVYTQEGMELIYGLFNNIANVRLQPTQVEQYSINFFANYDINRYKVWESFTNDFRSDIDSIPSKAAWYSLAQLNLLESPYSLYENDLVKNYSDKMLIDKPEWLELFFTLRPYFEKSALSLLVTKKDSWWTTMVNYLNQYSNDFSSQVNEVSYDSNLFKAVNTYQSSLLKLQKYVLALDDASSYNSVKSLFSSGGSSTDTKAAATSSQPKQNQFYQTYNAFQQVKFFATTDLNLINKNQATWGLYRGMFDLLFHGTMENAMCYTESAWNDQVLNQYASQLVHSKLSLDDLFGEKSIVNQFMVKYVYPFVKFDNQQGRYVPKSVFGQTFNLSNFVYAYIRDQYDYSQLQILEKQIQGTVKDTEEIIPIQTKPTNVNKNAKLLPVSTSLTVMCGGKNQSFINYDMVSNFSLTNNIFNCTSAVLSINFEGASKFSATKKYLGQDGLLDLINAFSQNGTVKFKSSEFGDVYSQLQDYNINDLTVSINFEGLGSVKSLLSEYTDRKANLLKIVNANLANWKYFNVTNCWNDRSPKKLVYKDHANIMRKHNESRSL